MSLHDALAGMRSIAQWFVWRLEWDGTEGKYNKTPCAHDGSAAKIDGSLPSNWARYESAANAVAMLNAQPQCADKTLQYALGFWMTADCGYWFFDLDKCVSAPYEMTTLAQQMVAAFPGALVEWSSSGRGVHVIGRGAVPPHRTKPPREIKLGLSPMEIEFYHQGRGIAFGLLGTATGSADTEHGAVVAQLVGHYFPARAEDEDGEWDKPRADWRGPADDDELIRRALNAKVSAEVAFGGKPGFADLWRGNCDHSSESDMALASHLSFWTGCDAPRIERLMRRSGLVRDKWDSHRTYLRELTIQNACNGCSAVYQEPERSTKALTEMYGLQQPPMPNVIEHAGPSATLVMPTANAQLVSPEMMAKIEALLDCVTGCGTVYDMHNVVIPAIREAAIPPALCERLVKAVNKKLDLDWDSKLAINKLRAMLCPPVVQGSAGLNESPLWVQKHCYVTNGDYFLDMENNAELTYQGFIANYGRLMPMKDNGSRENAAEWALHRWGMRTVHQVGYRPDKPVYFDWDGQEYANSYNPASVPEVASYTEAGIAGITAFQTMLFDMCGRRQAVFQNMLNWLAHNVQQPGVKIRWSPILKGTQGDGKSIVGNVLRSAMGMRNVGVTGNATLTASGGFTDWAVGYAVNVIEEIWLTGKERHRLYNTTKEFITNDLISINPKGKTKYNTFNTTNHCALSNHNDALPLDDDDRRWFVIFTPWANRDAMRAYCGLSPEQWKARTDAIDYAWKNCGGEFRAWFLGMSLVGFDKDGEAMQTPERMLMMTNAKDDSESVAMQVIADGALGISEQVISSLCLSQQLKIRGAMDNFDVPRGPALNYMLTRMGYSKLPKMVKWRGHPHTVWIRNGFSEDNDAVRLELERTGK